MCRFRIYGTIYEIKNNINYKSYIGQTIQEFDKRYDYGGVDVERVYNYHKSHKEQGYYYNEHLLNAFNKYGIKNFKINKKLDIAFSKKELDIKEKVWIKIKDSISNGYNMSEGGANGIPGIETRTKMSKNNSGMGNPNYGKAASELTREKMRKNHWSKKPGYVSSQIGLKGEKSPHYGKKRSEDTKMKISQALKGKIASKETRLKISEGRKGENNPAARAVLCLTTNKIFSTVREASNYYKCDASGISKCCRNKEKHCGRLEDGIKLAWCYL